MSEPLVETEHRVTPLELFFDLVYVFAFTQVTTLLADDVSWGGLGRAVLALTALWWAWASYAWLTTAVDAEVGPVLAVIFVGIAAMFVGALAVPEAFGSHRLVFGLSFVVVVAAFLGLYALAAKREADLLRAVLRIAPQTLIGALLILAAAFVSSGMRPVLWSAGLAVGFIGGLWLPLTGWRVHPAHFAERHGLIIIIAIGEALAAIGFGARGTSLHALVIVASVLGLLVAAAFWLAYFDFASRGVEQLLSSRRGEERVALARDAYTYLHLPMVLGIVLFAFGMKVTLAHVHARLHVVPAVALFGGCAVYLLAYVGLRWRVSRQLGRGRPTATVLFAALSPVALVVPAMAALAIVAAVWTALHTYELIWFREARARRRSGALIDGAVEAS